MNLKKLTPELVSGIIDAGFDKESREIQSLAIPKIKSGADLFVIAPEGMGKTTGIIFGVIQQLKQAVEMAPRAIIITSTKEKAEELDNHFKIFAKHTGLRSFLVYDQGNLAFQKDSIYEGVDVVIGTPRRITELLNTSGIPMVKLKMLMVDDADTLFLSQSHTIVHRIADGIDKIQVVLFADKWMSKFDEFADRIMKNPMVVELE